MMNESIHRQKSEAHHVECGAPIVETLCGCHAVSRAFVRQSLASCSAVPQSSSDNCNAGEQEKRGRGACIP